MYSIIFYSYMFDIFLLFIVIFYSNMLVVLATFLSLIGDGV